MTAKLQHLLQIALQSILQLLFINNKIYYKKKKKILDYRLQYKILKFWNRNYGYNLNMKSQRNSRMFPKNLLGLGANSTHETLKFGRMPFSFNFFLYTKIRVFKNMTVWLTRNFVQPLLRAVIFVILQNIYTRNSSSLT